MRANFGLLAIPVLLLTISGAATAALTIPTAPIASAPSGSPIQHIVVLMMENHAYDNYFGQYCLQNGTYCSDTGLGIPPGTCEPLNVNNTAKGCVKPYPEPWSAVYVSNGGGHDWRRSHQDWNNGLMNGFYQGQGSTAFGYYNGTTLPFYWDLAEQYSLADRFFSSTLTYSLPNHWYLVAGQAPASIEGPVPDLAQAKNLATADHEYLNLSNATPTILNELAIHPSVTWKYFDYPLSGYAKAISNPDNFSPGSAYNYWNPLAAKYQDYQAKVKTGFVGTNDFFYDAANGTLPNISWVIPNQYSDHPPANLSRGESFVSSVVDAIEASPDWNTTALFITWDEYGGYYDNIAPPVVDGYGYGFRVPMMLVSPYARENFIYGGENLSFDSLLAYEESTFGLGCLTVRDCTANLPTAMFNFSAPPRTPMLFSTNWTKWSYPMPLENATASWRLGPFAPSPYALSTTYNPLTEQD
jgi:phospholipase C